MTISPAATVRSAAPAAPRFVHDPDTPRVATFHATDVERLDTIEAREIGFDFARRGLTPPDDAGTAFRGDIGFRRKSAVRPTG